MVGLGLALAAGGPSVVAAADPAPGVNFVVPVAEPMVVGTDANGQSMTLSAGQELVVALPDDPSTGYSWQVGQVDAAVLHQEGDPQFRGQPGQLLPGGPGTSVWAFTAGDPGTTHLSMVSVKPGAAPAQEFTLDITVR
ncbi:inhibitor of cysteine peptidase [Nocardia transvalensis]|uniref:Inhibitor of cysteine peptidase n=1 Tax=Nocardia transvalensis TaxID=37333 RepID=A0A7W9PK88_9NOCA|nr:protease inhibitor I42 family protein [Nocardia transvalensis]MBB5917577.1 inhibitor of cysteine peptidase [Nocardia transvalensis]